MAAVRYRRKPNQAVVAVALDLETPGFDYQKWGAAQRCKAGDYIVSNGGDVYTVDRAVFERTYRELSPGQFVKTAPVWASVANAPGSVPTKEGVTHYEVGDYVVVSNERDGSDSYAISRAKFEATYELAPE